MTLSAPDAMSAGGSVDDLRRLAADAWAWRAMQQPAGPDDIPRLPRPDGWLPDFSPGAVDAARRTRDGFEARWRSIDTSSFSVADVVDHRLVGSLLARVTWELDVLQSWRRDPVFHVHQALGPYFDLLLRRPPFDDERSSAIIVALEAVPTAVHRAIESLDAPTRALTDAALELLDGLGQRLAESVDALSAVLPAPQHHSAVAAAPAAAKALCDLRAHLEGLADLDDVVGVGEAAFVWFLRNVALMPESPDELVHTARREWERARLWEAVAKHRAAPTPLAALPATAAEQAASEAERESEVRAFYDGGGLLSQPDSLRHYRSAPMPPYLDPLRFLGVCDELTDEHRLGEDGVAYVPDPSPDLPYFYAANARDPRAGIVHEGAHYQQLSLANAHANPIRRRYYDSSANEGIAFYNEEFLLQAGLFDDAPHTRSVIWNFARLRALRVEVDVRLATGRLSLDDAVDFFVARVPMDRETAFEESAMYAGNPGLAMSYQTGKTQLISLAAAAIEAQGEAFSLRDFHDFVWLNGNAPFSLLRWELLGDRSVLDAVDADPATGAPAPVAAG